MLVVECSVSLLKIPVMEQLKDLWINVFGFEEDEVCSLYISEKQNPDVSNLLLVYDDEKQHICLIRNFSRLMDNHTF